LVAKIRANPHQTESDINSVFDFFWRLALDENGGYLKSMESILYDFEGYKDKFAESLFQLISVKLENGMAIVEKLKKMKQSQVPVEDFVKFCSDFGLKKIEQDFNLPEGTFLNSLGSWMGFLNSPITSTLADIVAQCAEDNAAVKLLNFLDTVETDSININWYSTQRRGNEINHLPLCAVCSIRFGERLKELLEQKLSKRG